MGAWYFKQPNGLYGRFSTVVDTVTDWNMTKEELYQYFVDHYGKYDYGVIHFEEFVGNGQPSRSCLHEFSEVLDSICSGNETTETAQKLLIDMGVPEEEAINYYFMDYPEDAEDDATVWDTYTPHLLRKDENETFKTTD